MKKSNLIAGIIWTFAGVVCLLTALVTESKLDGLLFGFAGGSIASGVLMSYRYFYWNAPKNKRQYQERLETEKIDQHDELKVKLRDRSGRYAYVLGLVVISISMVVFSVLGALELIDHSRTIVLSLGGYLIFQWVCGIAFFNYLLKKY